MPPSLLILSPPLKYHRKLALDVHAVVVGASTTVLAALRSIMLRYDTSLQRVTLLAPCDLQRFLLCRVHSWLLS
jgi:hypothetical protein